MNNDTRASGKTGLCVKELTGKVTFQDAVCQRLCGDKANMVCQDGCMESVSLAKLEEVFERGIRLLKNLDRNGHPVDAVMINDGCQITTILYDKREQIETELQQLAEFGLSRSELAVSRLALLGFSNREIGEKLFISGATVRTHLNNIYKKIPADLKAKMIVT